VARQIAAARALEVSENWQGAFDAWTAALAALPPEKSGPRHQVRLAQARARMFTGELPEAIQDLETLLTDSQSAGGDAALAREVRATLAGAQYYAGWLMRLESAPADEWLLPVESARQHFRLLAEQAPSGEQAAAFEKNLEATIRLARMDLSELEGLPLPKFCSGCKNVSQKCRSQRESKCENPGEGEKEKKDACPRSPSRSRLPQPTPFRRNPPRPGNGAFRNCSISSSTARPARFSPRSPRGSIVRSVTRVPCSTGPCCHSTRPNRLRTRSNGSGAASFSAIGSPSGSSFAA
jgi:hypothetical protein